MQKRRCWFNLIRCRGQVRRLLDARVALENDVEPFAGVLAVAQMSLEARGMHDGLDIIDVRFLQPANAVHDMLLAISVACTRRDSFEAAHHACR